MAGPVDFELARRLIDEFDSHINGAYSEQSVELLRDVLYMTSSLMNGNWCDFGYEFLDDADSQDHCDIYEDVRRVFDALPCRPLLQPYFEQRIWSFDEITALRVKHRLTT